MNNAFLVSSSSPLAICYNDKSVLENHHAATLFRILASPETNILTTLPPPERRQLRRTVVRAILATDMAHHQSHIKELTEIVAGAESV